MIYLRPPAKCLSAFYGALGIMLALSIVLAASGCSPTVEALQPIPKSERVPLVIERFQDLTGLAHTAPSMDSLLARAMSQGMLDIDTPTQTDKFARASYQNPFRPAVGDTHNAYHLSGDIERIDYQNYEDIEAAIARHYFLGFVLSRLVSARRGDMAALVQYRLFLFDPYGACIDTLLVTGVDVADRGKASRRLMLALAVKFAACDCAMKLIMNAIDNEKVKGKRIYAKLRGTPKDVRQSCLECFPVTQP
jgi:hypothetical protein